MNGFCGMNHERFKAKNINVLSLSLGGAIISCNNTWHVKFFPVNCFSGAPLRAGWWTVLRGTALPLTHFHMTSLILINDVKLWWTGSPSFQSDRKWVNSEWKNQGKHISKWLVKVTTEVKPFNFRHFAKVKILIRTRLQHGFQWRDVTR